MNAREIFLDILKKNRGGVQSGVYSVCSSQENVIRASMRQALVEGSLILVESTSNQVDQNGGYTGMKPSDFVAYVHRIAAEINFPKEKVLLGGDHLGPNVWQNQKAEVAMQNSHVLIDAYVKAGYQKIHLDASMFLADDAGDRKKPLADEVVAARAASLCKTAELTWKRERPSSAPPVYIIGTEVPIPGGAQEAEDHVRPTSPEDVTRTIEITRAAFMKEDLQEAWERVVGVVVQPGVEFGDDQVFDYRPDEAVGLKDKIGKYERLVFEAHSTDYQTERGLSELVRDHFCILKVGPWLTYAYREALFALQSIEKELLPNDSSRQSRLREVMEEVMSENPKYWQKYYHGSADEQLFKRSFSFSDRCRYYWPEQKLQQAVATLFVNLRKTRVPLSLLSQYLPEQYYAVREGRIEPDPQALVEDRIGAVLRIYSRACGLTPERA